jgi:hypothetical protein
MSMGSSQNGKNISYLYLTSRWLLRKFGVEILFIIENATLDNLLKTKDIVNRLKSLKIPSEDDLDCSKDEKREYNRVYMPTVYRLKEGSILGWYTKQQTPGKQGYLLTPFGKSLAKSVNEYAGGTSVIYETFLLNVRKNLQNFTNI